MSKNSDEVGKRTSVWLGDQVDYVREKQKRTGKTVGTIIREAIKKAEKYEKELYTEEKKF